MLRVASASRQVAVRRASYRPHRNGFAAQTRFCAAPAAAETDRHVTVEVRDNIALLRLNSPNSKVNVLSEALNRDFSEAWQRVKQDNRVKGIVLISDKPGCFVAGADIEMLAKCKTAEEAQTLSAQGQQMFNDIENCELPVVAAVNGSCLGGGLELAMACHYRIAADNKKTKMGLPEVMLGLLPGAGGTQRLPKLVGLPEALGMMMTGKNVVPAKAKKIGLIDATVEEIGTGLRTGEENTMLQLDRVAIQTAQKLADKKLKANRDPKGTVAKIMKYALNDLSFGRNYVFKQAKESALKKTHGNYPAPEAILKVVQTGMEKGLTAGLAEEAKQFGQLSQTNAAKSLMSIFFGQTALKKNRYGKAKHDINTIGVLGAGLMGAGIGHVSLNGGYNVLLKDTAAKGLARGEQQIASGFEKDVKKRKLSAFDKDVKLSRLSPQLDNSGFENADMIIEAVFEDINIKHMVLNDMESVTPEHCIFASNTSALPIADIAKASKRPQNVIGMHYFSPVDKMPLLEIITTEQTSKDTIAAAVDVGLKQNKTVIVVKDGPGFYTTRILMPFMMEGFAVALQGLDFQTIDKSLVKFGFPVGPITLADEVGIDVGYHIAQYLGKIFPERMEGVNVTPMSEMVEKGFHGRKTKKGFFVYPSGKGKKTINDDAVTIFNHHLDVQGEKPDPKEVPMRLVGQMVNEAVLCLQDGILENPVDGDMGAVFGLGFPPFHGGPFRFVDTFGAANLVSHLDSLRSKYGPRFEAAPLLREKAKHNAKFHE